MQNISMSKILLDLYISTIESWNPPECPKKFQSYRKIREYEKDFRESYERHMKTLEGTVIRKINQQDPGDIGIVDGTVPSISYESAPRHKDGTYWVRGTSSGIADLKEIEVLDILTDGQKDRRELILKRIKESA